MNPDLSAAFINLGSVGLILWWLTQNLVPQLQQERKDAILAFQQEMEKERKLHQEVNQRLLERSDKAWEELLKLFHYSYEGKGVSEHGVPR